MSSSLKRVRRGAIVLGALFAVAVVGYRLAGREWLDAVYMVVITISTVGYGEATSLSTGQQLLTIGVIIFGISAAVFTFGGFIQMTMEGELERSLQLGRTTRAIDKLSDHVVLCGFGRIGQILAQDLSDRHQPFVIVDDDTAAIGEAQARDLLVLLGDATDEDVLRSAGVERARTLVTALPSDAANVFITLTARNMNRKLRIIARGEQQSTEKKLLQAGADRVVLPAAIGGMRMAAMVTRPAAIELMELVSGQNTLDVEVDEIFVTAGSPLVGRAVTDAQCRGPRGLLIIAVRQATGVLVFNPGEELVFQAGDSILAMGKQEDIDCFRKQFEL